MNNVIQIPVTQEGKPCVISLSDNFVQIPQDGGYVKVKVEAGSETCLWNVTYTAEWLFPSPLQGMGSGEILINVYDENPDMEARQGTITVGGQTVTVFQAGVGSPARLTEEQILGWWIPEQSGSGISIESHITGKDAIFLGWFAYDEEGMPAWYVASLEYSHDNIYSGVMFDVSGWTLGEPYTGYAMEPAGAIELNFASGDTCTVAYDLNGVQEEMEIQRFMTQDRYPGILHLRNISGWWKDPDWDGMGWFIETRGDSMYVVWYHFGDDSQTRWWGFSGGAGEFPFGQQSYTGELAQYVGGSAIGAEPKGYTGVAGMGQATLTDNGGGSISFEYNGVTYDLIPADF